MRRRNISIRRRRRSFTRARRSTTSPTARQAAHDGAQVIAVEGYVDVIAMVTAGFAATVAPLGTALTADQLGLMWRMADEPMLCFDGDDAGRRAAYRALDLAMPLLKPGKSLKFAPLPTARTRTIWCAPAAARRSTKCWRGARRSPHMLWTRETEGQAVRHAGAARGAGGAAQRGDRRHRRRDRAPILPAGFFRAAAAMFAPAQSARGEFSAHAASDRFGATAAKADRRAARRRNRPGAVAQPRRRLTSRRARNSRRARCIAARAPRCHRARR